MEACPIKHIAEAEHPSAGELIIAANLPAASKARIVCREVSKTKTEIRLAAAKYPADVFGVELSPVNVRDAGEIERAVALTVPPSVLARADEV